MVFEAPLQLAKLFVMVVAPTAFFLGRRGRVTHLVMDDGFQDFARHPVLPQDRVNSDRPAFEKVGSQADGAPPYPAGPASIASPDNIRRHGALKIALIEPVKYFFKLGAELGCRTIGARRTL
jgi:hypothetical protein